MAQIRLLDSNTIDRIAAGEVVERPSSVVKELVENAMDAGADAVTVEIRDGGCSFIRVTDNGDGIEKDQIRKAFFRHATSKISSAEDLFHIHSLGFRGEALSSIAAVSMVELITKTRDSLTGVHYRLDGGTEKEFSEIGAPQGTTMIARELFFNTPVRKKFLKTSATEGSYVSDLMEHMALSRPDVAFQFIMNGNLRFHTSGNGDLKEIIYRIYGREIAAQLLPFHAQTDGLSIDGFLGSPSVVRSNRNFEFFFVNGRYIRSPLLSKGLEAGYRAYLMQHKFPFALLHVTSDPENVDVNVHPAKMEVRFSDQPGLYAFLEEQVRTALHQREMIPDVTLDGPATSASSAPGKKKEPEQRETEKKAAEKKAERKEYTPSPMPPVREKQTAAAEAATEAAVKKPEREAQPGREEEPEQKAQPGRIEAPEQEAQTCRAEEVKPSAPKAEPLQEKPAAAPRPKKEKPEAPQPFESVRLSQMLQEEAAQYTASEDGQLALFDGKLLSEEAAKSYQIIGQVFDTYWLVQYDDRLLIIDQHAAHEKVKYEALVKKLREGKADSQNLAPPMILNLSSLEAHTLKEYGEYFAKMGFEIEDFGGNAVAVRAVPCDLYGHCEKNFLQAMLDELEEEPPRGTPAVIAEKLASMACKSAVKGNMRLSRKEMEALLDQLLSLDNPYHCPHGRPTIITMSRYELEKKFKRIV
ncbi:MAG TPA: DNA mismatch repair endonuclease MutL [Candidatus Eisenbergiella merdavium]|uniref:DNA mismatch repair protein MutL n=1 Tax=Candidatus Eisenbergiella merdavium TaxID=2838551 RepID=A0A9D2NG46_9FIRM|nr:DNA mismatch repair endonuclease MutL [Candidatus Eisenbergiella merdavium]